MKKEGMSTDNSSNRKQKQKQQQQELYNKVMHER